MKDIIIYIIETYALVLKNSEHQLHSTIQKKIAAKNLQQYIKYYG